MTEGSFSPKLNFCFGPQFAEPIGYTVFAVFSEGLVAFYDTLSAGNRAAGASA